MARTERWVTIGLLVGAKPMLGNLFGGGPLALVRGRALAKVERMHWEIKRLVKLREKTMTSTREAMMMRRSVVLPFIAVGAATSCTAVPLPTGGALDDSGGREGGTTGGGSGGESGAMDGTTGRVG